MKGGDSESLTRLISALAFISTTRWAASLGLGGGGGGTFGEEVETAGGGGGRGSESSESSFFSSLKAIELEGPEGYCRGIWLWFSL